MIYYKPGVALKDKNIAYLKIDKQKKTEVSFRGSLDKNR